MLPMIGFPENAISLDLTCGRWGVRESTPTGEPNTADVRNLHFYRKWVIRKAEELLRTHLRLYAFMAEPAAL